MTIHSAKDLGAYVRTHRKKRGWTQRELAFRCGARALWISQFERGKATAQIGLVIQTLKALDLQLWAGSSPEASPRAKGMVVDLDSLVRPASVFSEGVSMYNAPEDSKK